MHNYLIIFCFTLFLHLCFLSPEINEGSGIYTLIAQPLLQHTLDIGFVILYDGLVILVLEERRRDQEIGR